MIGVTGSALVAYVRACTNQYKGYYLWPEGDIQARGFHMKLNRGQWELWAALYRVMRRKALGL